MTTKADQFRSNALHEVGEEYQWGETGTGGVAGKDEYDCSGFYWAMLNDVGVKNSRTTADGYKDRGVRIDGPARVGSDFAVLLRSNGTAHHIIPYVGKGETVEAKGEAWGLIKGTVSGANARGAVWYRIGKYDLGALTKKVPAPQPHVVPVEGRVYVASKTMGARWGASKLLPVRYKVVAGDKLVSNGGVLVNGWAKVKKNGRTSWFPWQYMR